MSDCDLWRFVAVSSASTETRRWKYSYRKMCQMKINLIIFFSRLSNSGRRAAALDNAGPNTSWPINAAIHLISNKSHVSILTVQFYVWENSRRRPFTFRLFHFCFIFLLFSSSCLAGPIEWTRANECEIINKIVYGNNANWMRMWDRETSEAGQAVREMTNSEKMDICFVIL